MSTIVNTVLVNYTGHNKTSEHAWDYLQRTMKCCGWTGPSNWTENLLIKSQKNNSQILYPCSCRNDSISGTDIKEKGLCEALSSDWPVFTTGCVSSVEDWLQRNYGDILGVLIAIAVIELLGMMLSMCLCKSVQQEDYTKVPKYWEPTPLQWLCHSVTPQKTPVLPSLNTSNNNWNQADQTTSITPRHTHTHTRSSLYYPLV